MSQPPSSDRRLRVGLLLHALDRPLSGVTRVAVELARALSRRPDCDVIGLSSSKRASEPGLPVAHWLPGTSRVPGLMLLGGPLTAVAARRLRLDVVHDPIGASPFTVGRWVGRFGRVLTIHDAIAFEDPDGYSLGNRFLHRRFVPATLRNVDAVITVSEAARDQLVRFLGLAPERISVVPNGVSTSFRPIASEAAGFVAARYGLTRPYVLHVGSAQRRKNVPGLLEAFARLREDVPGCRLALAGPPIGDPRVARDAIDRLGLRDAVVTLGPVPDADLPALYSAAELLALPSLHEGFGLPVLEAMACGTPVVAADIPALAETAGGAALLVDPRDATALAEAMRRLVVDAPLRRRLRAAGLQRAAGFNWDRAAEHTIAVYREVATRAGRDH